MYLIIFFADMQLPNFHKKLCFNLYAICIIPGSRAVLLNDPVRYCPLCHIAVHEDKVAQAARHYEKVKYFMGTEIFVRRVEQRKL
jgi:hypothetical protein